MKTEEKRSLDARHDLTRWKARPFVILVVSFFIFMAVMFVVLGGLTRSWVGHDWPPNGSVKGPQSTPGWNASTPQLQTEADALADLHRMQRQEYLQLHATKWTDDSHAYAVIPIERAMDLIVAAEAGHRLDQLLPPPKPATPIELQNQKSTEASP